MCSGFGKWKRRDPIWADSPLGQCCRNPPEWHNSKSERSRLGRHSHLGVHPREKERKLRKNISLFAWKFTKFRGTDWSKIFRMILRFLFFAFFLEIGNSQEYKCGDASQLTQWCTSQNGTLQVDIKIWLILRVSWFMNFHSTYNWGFDF